MSGFFVFFTNFSLHSGTRQSAKGRSHWDTRLSGVNLLFMPVPWKICHPSTAIVVLIYLMLLSSWWYDDFLSCSKVGVFHLKQTVIQTTQSALGKKNNCMLHCVTLMQLDLEWKQSRGRVYSKADLSKGKWNGVVSCSQHSHFGTCPFKWKFVAVACISFCF